MWNLILPLTWVQQRQNNFVRFRRYAKNGGPCHIYVNPDFYSHILTAWEKHPEIPMSSCFLEGRHSYEYANTHSVPISIFFRPSTKYHTILTPRVLQCPLAKAAWCRCPLHTTSWGFCLVKACVISGTCFMSIVLFSVYSWSDVGSGKIWIIACHGCVARTGSGCIQ